MKRNYEFEYVTSSFLDFDFSNQVKKPAKKRDRKQEKKNGNRHRHTRATGKSKWVVVTKFYDDGRVVVSYPIRTESELDACGWTSHSYINYDEYSDIFDSERGAELFINEVRIEANRQLKGSFSMEDGVSVTRRPVPGIKKIA